MTREHLRRYTVAVLQVAAVVTVIEDLEVGVARVVEILQPRGGGTPVLALGAIP